MQNCNVSLDDIKSIENALEALGETASTITKGCAQVSEAVAPLGMPVIAKNVTALSEEDTNVMKPTIDEGIEVCLQAINVIKTVAMAAGHQ